MYIVIFLIQFIFMFFKVYIWQLIGLELWFYIFFLSQ
jgi:hypothetical protein